MRLGLPALVASGALIVAGAVTGCGGTGHATEATHSFSGDAVPARTAPPIQLRDYRGRQVSLAGLRGKAVVVAFLYTHCPDLCPLVAGKLKAAESLLGSRARAVRLLAVSVDPARDTPESARAFDRRHQLSGKLDWLLGSRAELARTWRAWRIVPQPNAKDPEVIEHSADLFGLDAAGRIRVLYPPSFSPSGLAGDLRKLASE